MITEGVIFILVLPRGKIMALKRVSKVKYLPNTLVEAVLADLFYPFYRSNFFLLSFYDDERTFLDDFCLNKLLTSTAILQ